MKKRKHKKFVPGQHIGIYSEGVIFTGIYCKWDNFWEEHLSFSAHHTQIRSLDEEIFPLDDVTLLALANCFGLS